MTITANPNKATDPTDTYPLPDQDRNYYVSRFWYQYGNGERAYMDFETNHPQNSASISLTWQRIEDAEDQPIHRNAVIQNPPGEYIYDGWEF